MSRARLEIPILADTSDTDKELFDWMRRNGYGKAQFEDGKFEVSVWSGNQAIFHRLKEPEKAQVFYKEGFGGSLLVFETKEHDGKLLVEGYSPILLFGFFPIEMRFRPKALWIFKYLREGFEDLQSFEAEFGKQKRQR